MSHGLTVTASNVKDLDNYVLYRVWKEATTKRERSLAMKEIKRRQGLGNMVESHSTKKFTRKQEVERSLANGNRAEVTEDELKKFDWFPNSVIKSGGGWGKINGVDVYGTTTMWDSSTRKQWWILHSYGGLR
ncbi:MAG: hypothetical protein KGZ51_03530 [Erysipelothrix sp.]|nr:hypothetical protein [Erysipelothrix sp.]